MFKLGYFQFAPAFGDVAGNLKQVTAALSSSDAKRIRADLIVLPELAFTGYYFEDKQELLSLAEDPTDSETVRSLTELCRQQDFYIITGFAERSGDKVYNSALLIGPKGLVSTYRKLHLFKAEKEYFEPGDIPLGITEVRGANIGMMVCFDWQFPEVARVLALKGADIICHPSNLVLAYCQQTMLSRSLENAVYSVTTNRFGSDIRPRGQLDFTGQSQVVGPKGEIIHRGPVAADELFITEIDFTKSRDKLITENNDRIKDRRPEFYKALLD